MTILGIETSCDETSAAVLEVKHSKFKLLSTVVSSSEKIQAKYGGIVPEIAARKQIEYMIPVLEASLDDLLPTTNNQRQNKIHPVVGRKRSGLSVDCIAVTVGPGLATSLQVGIDTAKTLAYVWQKPIIPVNHLEGHLYSPLLQELNKTQNLKLKTQNKGSVLFPAVGLIVSGGHTELILVKDYLKYKLLGRTRDDAAGEAYDKVAKLLGLGYPGGPVISKLAVKGKSVAFDFPRGMLDSSDYDFSFSGLKTSVLYKTKELGNIETMKLLDNICSSFQQAVVDVLVAKTIRAAKEYKAKTLLLGGGVAANLLLRKALAEQSKKIPITYSPTPITYSGDNAAMIALAGYFRYRAGNYIKPRPQLKAWQNISAQPNLKLV